MLNALESSLIIAACIAAALVCLVFVRRFWLPRAHRQHNDVIGWQVASLGTMYAVVIAFMLADVWRSYQAAQTNAESEANSLLNLYRLADGLPSPQREELRSLTKQYGQLMIQDEWPAMRRGTFSAAASRNILELWRTILSIQPGTSAQQAVFQRVLTDLANLVEQRRVRHLDSSTGLPFLFWVLLIAGGVMTVLYTCFFDVEDTGMHIMQVVGVTFIVALVLVTIEDVDGPYGGALRIPPSGFVMALNAMNREAK